MKIFSGKTKGSLQLSINAIVIMVLAIVLLGLGLTFIRGLFKRATGQFEEFFESTSLETPPDKDTRISPLAKFTIKANSEKPLKLGYYNAEANQQNNAQFVVTECIDKRGDAVGKIVNGVLTKDAAVTANAALPQFNTISQSVPASQFKSYDVIVTLENYPAGNYICKMQVCQAQKNAAGVRVCNYGTTTPSASVDLPYYEKQFSLVVTG